jgi:hypothetical protein
MDIEKAVSNEVFKPLVGVIIPGAIAVAPYVIVTQAYVPKVLTFWHDHESSFVALVLACMIAAGLALEDIGAFIEHEVLDPRLEKSECGHVADWDRYLQLKMKDEYIGQRYVRTLVTRLKFELSMFPALLILTGGIVWIQALYQVWSRVGIALLSAFLLCLSAFMLWQAWLSTKALSKTRKLLLQVAQPTGV